MRVTLRHPGTGQHKTVETGWSWSLFLGAGVFGVPLFFRGMAFWGSVMFVLWTLQVAEPFIGASDGTVDAMDWILTIALAALCIFLGMKGNQLTARHYLACGYEFVDPEAVESRIAARDWGLI